MVLICRKIISLCRNKEEYTYTQKPQYFHTLEYSTYAIKYV